MRSGGATTSIRIVAGSNHWSTTTHLTAIDRSTPVSAIHSIVNLVTTASIKSMSKCTCALIDALGNPRPQVKW